MDAAQALADLMEISSQVRAAVVVAPGGDVEAVSPEGAGEALGGAVRELLEAAAGVRTSGESSVTQLEAATRDGSLFLVRDDDRVVAATTGAAPTVGLVFYDLKTCLRALASPEAPEAGEPE